MLPISQAQGAPFQRRIVLGMPPQHSPAMTRSLGSPRALAAALQSSSGGTPAKFAEVAVTGPTASASSRASRFAKTRTAIASPPAPHKDFSDFYEKMSDKGESTSEVHTEARVERHHRRQN